MAEQPNSTKTRPSQACEVCHEKKVRCDLAEGSPCSNCRTYNVFCRPHQRKRKRTALPPASPPKENNGWMQESQDNPTTPNIPPRSLPTQADQSPIRRRDSLQISAPSQFSVVGQLCTPAETSGKNVEEEMDKETPESRVFLGRSEYLGVAAAQGNEEVTEVRQFENGSMLSKEERACLEIYRAFDIPPPAVQRTLFDSFRKYCAPWMPIVDNSWLQETDSKRRSLLLLQCVFLAGSRVASAPHISAYAEQYYRRAKALFFSSYERNPIIKIAAACILNWWNPSGPDEISLDGSIFWLRVAVTLAFQIGLHREPQEGLMAKYRRRLWWSMVARDCQQSAAHGRPRAINLVDANVAPPTIQDFSRDNENAELFVAYVNVSVILGEVTQSCLRNELTALKRREIRNALSCWVNELPPLLRLFRQEKLTGYEFTTRMLHVPYFVTLTILYRPGASQDKPTPASVVAASFLCGIFEEFLTRDDFRFVGAIYKFYVFAAGMAAVHAQAYIPEIDTELDIVNASLKALAERWPSANNNIKTLNNIRNSRPAREVYKPEITPMANHHDILPLFQTFGPDLCQHWYLLENRSPQYYTQIADSRRPPEGASASLQVQPGEFLTALDTVSSFPELDQTDPGNMLDPSTLWAWWPAIESGNWLCEEAFL